MAGNREIVLLIRKHIEDPDVPNRHFDDVDIAAQMNQAGKVIARKTKFLRKIATVNLVQGTQDYDLPPRWVEFPKAGVDIFLDTNTPPKVRRIQEDRQREHSLRSLGERTPTSFTVWDNMFSLDAPSNISIANGIRYTYFGFPTPFVDLQLSNRDPGSDFPEKYEQALIYQTAGLLLFMDNEEAAGDRLMALANNEIREMKAEELERAGDPGQVQQTYDELNGDLDGIGQELHTF